MRARLARLVVEQLEDRRVPALVTYHGGMLMPHVEVEPVFYGRDWSTSAGLQQAGGLDAYLQYVTNSSYMDLLAEYGVGHGSLLGTGGIDSSIAAGQVVDDTAIEAMLSRDIARGTLPPTDATRLYVVYTQANVVVTLDGQSSQTSFYGYHNSFTDASGRHIVYAVIVHPVGNGDIPNLTDMQTLTAVTSHELAEAVTDPNSDGWFDDSTGEEIGDIANGHLGILNGYAVQAEWSQAHHASILPVGAQPFDPTGGTPASPSLPGNLYGVASQIAHSAEAYQLFISNAYEQYLGRSPDALGLEFWTTQLQNGFTDEQLEASFLGSPEYITNHGGTNEGWIKGMYQSLLGRTPAADEVAYWTGQLAQGAQPYQVALGFAASAEREGKRISHDYSTLLNRSADPDEVSHWVGVFESGVSNESLTASLVASPEYYQKALKGNSDRTTWITSVYNDVLHRAPSNAELQDWLAILG